MIRYKSIQSNAGPELRAAAELITRLSWGADYPVSPLSELLGAEFCIGAFSRRRLVGFAAVSRNGSPDGRDSSDLWFGYAVVTPELRRQGIFEQLYRRSLLFLRTVPGRIFSCTDNPIVINFLLRQGWQYVRTTRDESGDSCLVFQYPREKYWN